MSTRFAKRLSLLGLLGLFSLLPAAFAQSNNTNVTTEQIQDWQVECPTDGGRCAMSQLVNNPSDNQPVMRVVAMYPEQFDGAALTFLVPLGVILTPGLELTVDGSAAAAFPYQSCQPGGCRADLPAQPELLQRLRGGSVATLSFIDPSGMQRDLDFSLSGFTAALNRIAP
ncbi:invasion associated locus B family protein [Halomonas halocynthiae]|uniref:invasion associated locus B family protein n=1 Tax=Halomonas halocynthiae TaxID=176290 RepID=UPI0004220F5F|nr:invasion associated locus B family protein [Halomonas halocynthiae]